MTPLTDERLDELEGVARELAIRSCEMANGSPVDGGDIENLDDLLEGFELLLTELRTLRASAAELSEIRHRMGEPR